MIIQIAYDLYIDSTAIYAILENGEKIHVYTRGVDTPTFTIYPSESKVDPKVYAAAIREAINKSVDITEFITI